MKRLALGAAAALALSAASLSVVHDARSAPGSATWSGDTVHSFVLFKIRHMGASWVWGRFDDFAVSIEADDTGSVVKSVSVDVKTGSVDTGNKGRDDHLKGPDFFNAKQFEDVTFKSTSVKAAGDGAWDVTGDVTMLGVTKPLTVKVTKVGAGKGMKGESLAGFETTFVVKRTDFGMKTYAGPIGEDVTLTVCVEASKQ